LTSNSYREKRGSGGPSWDRERPNLLKIFAEHPTLKRYLGSPDEKYPGQDLPHFRVLLAEIVADKVVQRVFEARLEANPRLFGDSDKFFPLYSEEMTAFLPKAHKIIISDSDANRFI